MSSAAASFAQQLPYWTTLSVATGPAPSPVVACILLKDGTLAFGFRAKGLDLYAADNSRINAYNAAWQQALASLPDQSFCQTLFTSGHGFDATLHKFAERGNADSHALLRRGRLERHKALQNDAWLSRCRITHWIGRVGWLRQLNKQATAAALAVNSKVVQQHALQLWQELAPLLACLKASGQHLVALDERALAHACAVAVRAEPTLAQPPQLALATPCDLMAPNKQRVAALGGTAFADMLSDDTLAIGEDHLRLCDKRLLLRVSAVHRFGELTHAKMLHDVLYSHAPGTPWTLSITHEKTDQVVQKERLQQRRKWLYALVGSRFLNHEAKQAYQQTEEVLAELSGNNAQIFHTSIQCVTTGDSHETLDVATQSVREGLRKQGMHLATLQQAQLSGWLSTLPANGHRASAKIAVLDGNCAHLQPNWLPSLGDADADLLLANRQRGLFGLSVALGKRNDASAIVVGKTGSGKTFLFSFLAKYGCLDLGGHVVIADNKGPKNSSYRPLCELLGGSYVHLDGAEDVSFNPFPSRDEVMQQGEVQPQRTYVLEKILAMMVGDKLAVEHEDYLRSVISDIVRITYTNAADHRRPLILADALAAFGQYQARNQTLQAVAHRAKERLEFWCEDPVRRRLFNTPNTVDTSNRFCVFDFHGLDRDPLLSAVLISAFTGRIESKMRDLPVSVPKLFAFDEAWAMFDSSPVATQLLNRLYRTARSYGACCYVMTQNQSDIRNSQAASGILSNLGLIFLMRHQEGHAQVAELFGLNARQHELFASLRMEPGAYAETFMLDCNSQQSHLLHYAPLAFDLWCDTSRATDVDFRNRCLQASGLPLESCIAYLAQLAPRGAPVAAEQQEALLVSFMQLAQIRSEAG